MAESLGSLVVSLGLQAASYTAGLDKATYQAKQFVDKMTTTFKTVGAAIGLAFTADAFVDMIKGSIEASAHLDDLSKKTGIAATTIGGIGFAARQAGGDLEMAVAAAGKLNKQLAEAAAGTPLAKEAFTALGISVLDAAGNTKKADVAMAEIATKFAGYADGPEKVALAVRLFGKAGADLIPVLDDGGQKLSENIEYYKTYSGVTDESAKAANEFTAELTKAHLLQGQFADELSIAVLPMLRALVEAFTSSTEKGDLLTSSATLLGTALTGVAQIAAFVVASLSAMSSRLDAIVQKAQALKSASPGEIADKTIGDRFRSLKDWINGGTGDAPPKSELGAQFAMIDKLRDEDIAKAQKQFEDFMARTQGGLGRGGKKPLSAADWFKTSAAAQANAGGLTAAPRLPSAGAGAAADTANAEFKKQLDGQLQAIKDNAKQEEDLVAYKNKALDAKYQDGVISLQTALASEEWLRGEDVANQLAAQDAIIAAEKAFAAKTTKPADKIDAANKIAAAEHAKTAIVTKGQQDEALALTASDRAVLALKNSYDDLRASIMSMVGDDAGAAQIKIAQQVAAARILITQSGGDPATGDAYAAALTNAQNLTAAQKAYGDLVLKTQNAEEMLYLAAAAGGKGELETLAALGVSRRAAIVQLQEMVDKANEAAAKDPSPEAKKFADGMTLSLEKAKGEVDPLAKRINSSLEDSFANAFTGFIAGTKSASQAFSDFASSVISEIANIAAKKLAASLFGGDSGQGGFGGLLSGLLSGLMGGGPGPGALSPVSGMGTTGPIGYTMPLAEGTDYVPYDGFKASLHKGERVVPAALNVGGNPAGPNITFNVASGVARNELVAMVPGLKAQIKAELLSTMRRPGFQRA